MSDEIDEVTITVEENVIQLIVGDRVIASESGPATQIVESVVRILAAVAAGQTTIVDNGGGTATVTFRDVNDTKDRVVAEMTGSEHVSLTLDGDQ